MHRQPTDEDTDQAADTGSRAPAVTTRVTAASGGNDARGGSRAQPTWPAHRGRDRRRHHRDHHGGPDRDPAAPTCAARPTRPRPRTPGGPDQPHRRRRRGHPDRGRRGLPLHRHRAPHPVLHRRGTGSRSDDNRRPPHQLCRGLEPRRELAWHSPTDTDRQGRHPQAEHRPVGLTRDQWRLQAVHDRPSSGRTRRAGPVPERERLSVDHGYPLRLIAPDRPGVLQTKWLHRVDVP